MNDKTRDRLQREIANSKLYTAVCEADDALRSRCKYDLLDQNERRFALLCIAVERAQDRLSPRESMLNTLDLITKGIL